MSDGINARDFINLEACGANHFMIVGTTPVFLSVLAYVFPSSSLQATSAED